MAFQESKRVGEQTVHVYQSVIDDVIARVKPEFVQEGVDESVLDELRALWEAKLVQTGVLGDVNQTEAAQVLGSAQAPRPAALQYRQPGAAAAGMVPGMALPPSTVLQQQFAAAQQFAQLHGMTQLMQPQMRYPGMPPSLPTAAFAAPAAGVVGDKRKLDTMQAGAAAATGPPVKREQLAAGTLGAGAPQAGALRPGIPQQDGPADDGEGEGEPSAAATGGDEAEGEGDEELNEDDDLAAVDDEEVDEEQLKDVVLGQFDKVSRTKARWKVQLRDCIITAGGRDYLVHKATGEMNF